MNNNIIEIKQLPIIEERLQTLKNDIEERTSIALSMKCTEDTVKDVKKVRAELRKECDEYETRRKQVKTQIEAPYKKFEEVYKECVSIPFKTADNALKCKISEVENGLKKQKEDKVITFANELKTAFALDWLDIKRIMPNITLSASVSSLTAQLSDILEKINIDCQCIAEIENSDESAELLAEYKKTLNISQAKLTVSQRRREIEKAKADAQRKNEQEQVKQETEKKVEMLAPPAVSENLPEISTENTKLYKMTFTVSGTKEQLRTLKAFIINNNIEIIGGK